MVPLTACDLFTPLSSQVLIVLLENLEVTAERVRPLQIIPIDDSDQPGEAGPSNKDLGLLADDNMEAEEAAPSRNLD